MTHDAYGLDTANYDEAIRRWKQDKEFGTRRHCKQDRERDLRASDGIVSYGGRTIAKDGSFRFGSVKWQNELLVPLAGTRIGVCAGDYWLGHVRLYTFYPGGKYLMTLGNPN